MTDQVTASGIDIDELDPGVRPQDDLFRHVNGKWIARTEIPNDKARWGSFYLLAEEAEKAVQEIILEAQTAAEGTEERKFGDMYASFMDEERIEALGTLAPGSIGDATIMDLVDAPVEFKDSLGVTKTGNKSLGLSGVVIGGKWWHEA